MRNAYMRRLAAAVLSAAATIADVHPDAPPGSVGALAQTSVPGGGLPAGSAAGQAAAAAAASRVVAEPMVPPIRRVHPRAAKSMREKHRPVKQAARKASQGARPAAPAGGAYTAKGKGKLTRPR
jgi:hypothetical protein